MREIKLYDITKGFSKDKKYVAEMNGEKVVVRLFDNQERKEREYAVMEEAYGRGVNCANPITIETGKMVSSFIEGIDGEEAIHTLSAQQQYDLGVAASADLRKIHTIEANENTWYEGQVSKYRRYIARYQELPLKIEGDTQIMQFIEERIHLMKGRPSVLQHDDFHLPNLIVNDGHYNGVIDFGRFDYGDPVHDFIKLGMFSAELSVPFCKGLLEGYYGGQPSEAFWELYALYLAMGVFSAIVWGQLMEDGANLLQHAKRFTADHDGFTRVVPRWYEE
ncbi:aminoglycoside phosphotransferase family protein [Solibacillus sp. MA9]|uniref:Aminoglycoside phosphotransferase family protein n=1 Tax=Solibacillus palustris TaxID=2908203 RepID=A0ABS9UG89_9BACL|nr:aminoglycoside phosphotransferase family protein [Solibacillus sp. MA9]MCH7323377.1 aminoglycoside phosphotransferase family protein [Solibacillus sp. MA9]